MVTFAKKMEKIDKERLSKVSILSKSLRNLMFIGSTDNNTTEFVNDLRLLLDNVDELAEAEARNYCSRCGDEMVVCYECYYNMTKEQIDELPADELAKLKDHLIQAKKNMDEYLEKIP